MSRKNDVITKSHELDVGLGNSDPGHIGSWIRVFSSQCLGVGVGLHCREKGGIEGGKKKNKKNTVRKGDACQCVAVST